MLGQEFILYSNPIKGIALENLNYLKMKTERNMQQK